MTSCIFLPLVFFDDDSIGETGGEDGLKALGEGLAHVEFAGGEVEGAVGDAVFACFGLGRFHSNVVVIKLSEVREA